MRSANSYQDIKTPEDDEYDELVDTIFEELCDCYADEIEEYGMKPANRAALMQRARKIAQERMRKREEENE